MPLFFLQAQPGGGSVLTSFLPLVLVFAIFYFLIIRPQQKRQKQAQLDREQLLQSLKVGDKVVTTGGIFGTIAAVRQDTLTLRIAEKVNVEVLRSAISAPQSGDSKDSEEAK
jgi:preprotein translocase subunit YajC